MVSNGKTLVVKNRSNNQNYVYPLKKTPLSMILDKKYIISQIEKLRINNITDDTIDFLLIDKNLKINIFFDKKTNNLKGWQTEDMYQNKQTPEEIIDSKGLSQVTNVKEIELIIDQILKLNYDKVNDYKAGKTKLLGFFVGQAMQVSKGKVNPKMLNDILIKKLS